jgi:hypothetical protein
MQAADPAEADVRPPRARSSSSGSSEGAVPKPSAVKKRRQKRPKKADSRKAPVSDAKRLLQQVRFYDNKKPPLTT